ncbi:MAG: GNAT family N-acetyltransferase [Alphaproteobacteria bacterium]
MIRKFEPQDTDAVVASWRAAAELAHPFLSKAFLEKEADAVRNVYLKFAQTWVTEIDGKVVGFIAMVDSEIGGLFLIPHHHNQGLGRAMVDKAVAEIGDLTVEVFTKNTIGRRFYDGYGFEETGEFIHHETGEATLKMAFMPE